jgi:2'-5' RNA ligase superfamily
MIVVAIDVLIEPDAALADAARALNARLRADDPRGIALDATHLPHISILHRFVRRTDLAALNALVAQIVAGSALADAQQRATGYGIGEWQGETSVSIDVQRTPALQRLQQELEHALAPFAVATGDADAFARQPGPPEIDAATIDYVTRFVPERMGERWSPHVTVGTCSAGLGATLAAEGFAPRDFSIARFAVYQLGNKGTARLRLWPPR